MRLRLVRPMVTKGSANSYFVKRIPADLRERLIGQTVLIPVGEKTVRVQITESTQSIRFSLGSATPSIVRQRQAQTLAFVEKLFDELRANQPVTLSGAQVAALAGELHASWARDHEASPQVTVTPSTSSRDTDHETDPHLISQWNRVYGELAERASSDPSFFDQPQEGIPLSRLAELQGRLKGIPNLSDRSLGQLTARIPTAVAQGMHTAARKLTGDYSADSKLATYPHWKEHQEPGKAAPDVTAASISLTGLVDKWWVEAKATGKSVSTYESYRNSFRLFSSFLGHDDALRVMPEDVVAFKDHRLTAINPKTGKAVSAKTVKASDLTAFKSVFDWAVANLKMPTNPAAMVRVKLGKKIKVRERDFTAEEIKALLKATNALAHKTKMNQTELARRWVPWLCAYTGARVGELVQLRKEDVTQDTETGTWILRITPEAGTVKTGEYREVPLHDHIIELGFIAFIRRAPAGYLFMTLKPGKTFNGVWQSKKNRLAEFAREYVTDPNVAPNHGWRHTFKSRGFEAGIQEKVLDAICGHAPRSVGQTYGSVTMRTKVDAIAKFTRYEV